jgi:hypothetical protein
LDGISSLAARPQYGQVIIEIKVINADHDTKAAGSGRAGIGSLNKEASTVAPRGFRAGPTTLDHALVVTEEDGGTPQAYSDRDRSQASFCLGRSKAAGNGGAKPSGKITNEAKAIGRFYGTRQREVHCDVRFSPKSGHRRCAWECPLCAKSRRMHRSKMTRYSITPLARHAAKEASAPMQTTSLF